MVRERRVQGTGSGQGQRSNGQQRPTDRVEIPGQGPPGRQQRHAPDHQAQHQEGQTQQPEVGAGRGVGKAGCIFAVDLSHSCRLLSERQP